MLNTLTSNFYFHDGQVRGNTVNLIATNMITRVDYYDYATCWIVRKIVMSIGCMINMPTIETNTECKKLQKVGNSKCCGKTALQQWYYEKIIKKVIQQIS